ncbi:MAG: hypothetical protein AAF411_06825 [Myxococcota bacterium]
MKSKPFSAEFEFDGDTLEAEATYVPERGGFDLVIRRDDAIIDQGVWSPDAYSTEGFANEELAEAAVDRFFEPEDFYTDKWEVTMNTLEAREGDVSADAVDRIGGVPIGVSVKRWPVLAHLSEPMQHIITVDAGHFEDGILPKGTAAVALFMWNPDENEAFEPATAATQVLFLSKDDLSAGEIDDRPEGYDASREVEAAQLVVKEETGPFGELEEHIGRPIGWCQGPEGEDEGGPFLFQFTESLIDINLGDAGTMYVFRDAAWWQCH